MKVFFSYASEDKDIVEQVYQILINKYPDIQGWLDKFEIKAGNQLIDKIIDGINTADKFLVFLSSKSISKPWVSAELRKAVMKELKNINPEFVIPIKIGEINNFPAFLESKKYIDLSKLSQEEWLRELYSAIFDKSLKSDIELKKNLEMIVTKALDTDKGIGILFRAKYWAEPIGFTIKTKKKIIQQKFDFSWRHGPMSLNYTDLKEDYAYSVFLPTINITPGKDFIILINFEESIVNSQDFIASITKWDGYNGNAGFIFIGGENPNYKGS